MMRDLFLGFIRLHIFYHAAEAPIFGLDMIRELARHGYELSPAPSTRSCTSCTGPATWNRSPGGGRQTAQVLPHHTGRAALAEAMAKVRELVDEVGL